ncbi:Ppx/GppA phosphatase family protein [Dichotomicrobium thermohalophilum]|uniref:Exopolyphosphatase/guanosine-5'-triphosphate, 3'-diphosphate pyrophosphatase n=1 Tax=Dichotomicrobium thermohalophilum TaxID=933063 RepID=A0A397Q779_9HYPH|nr:Ppx/GppA phosphatase family protein [Dichotomicrobium thermohalophilum]RIA56833.1 exopolyphosphatase/guanosine-5'-triphosphate,3'-diphosphate pyrophosphatase [Dichotomicrobium thermohalophilum]
MQQDDRPRFDRRKPVAVIDIGSNSVRLVIFEGLTRSPTQLHNESVTCRLGSGVARTGRMKDENVARALDTLRRFRALITHMGVKMFHPFATAAVRIAANGDEFIAAAERICGTRIEILSDVREAELTANGILSGFMNADGLAGDIGGRSLELVEIRERNIRLDNPRPRSLALGHLYMHEAYGDDFNAGKTEADRALSEVDWLDLGKDRPFYAIGGEWRAIARLHMVKTGYPLRIYHGYQIDADEAQRFTRDVVKSANGAIPGIDQISRNRRDTIRHACLVMWRLLKRVKPSRVVISAFGVREGLHYTLLEEKERARDPLVAACEDAAVIGGRSLDYVRELCDWTDNLFALVGHEETAEERRLRRAACLLSDVGWRAHPDYRGEQSLNLSAHWAVAGTDHPGRLFIALANYYRHEGSLKGELSPLFRNLLAQSPDGERAHERARILGSAMRVAYIISAGTPGIISRTPLEVVDGRLTLNLPPKFREFDGERVRQRLDQLASVLNLDSSINADAADMRAPRLVSALTDKLR